MTSSSVNIKSTHNTKETWRMKLEDTEEADLKPGEGGRVKALDAADVMVNEGFKNRGETNKTGIQRAQEAVHQKYSAALQHASEYSVTQHNIPLVPPQTSTYSSLATHEEGKKDEYSSLQHGKSKAGGDKEKALLQHPKTKASGERKNEEYSSLQHEKGEGKDGRDKEKDKYSHLQHHKTKAGSESVKEEYSVLQHQKDKAGETERKEEYSVLKDETTVAERMSDANSEYPCISMWKHNKYLLRKKGTPPPPEQVAAWFPEERKWPVEKKDKLKVYFMNECPREWKCRGDVITRQRIMELLDKTWRNCFTALKRDPHIRVAFHGDGARTWSALGTVANSISEDKPTMVLNFSTMKDSEIIATIVHQFGHALGLGHALMKPEDWHVLRKYVDQRQMMEFYGSPTMEEFEVQWTGKGLKQVVNYDEESVMQYRTDLKWLKEATYRTIQGNESKLSKTDKKLKIFHKHTSYSTAEPSARDLDSIHTYNYIAAD